MLYPRPFQILTITRINGQYFGLLYQSIGLSLIHICFYWGGLEENDVGLDEFLLLSRLVGFEPPICFNMMTSDPFKARQLVEYLNATETCLLYTSKSNM